jgi:hypothetical protein
MAFEEADEHNGIPVSDIAVEGDPKLSFAPPFRRFAIAVRRRDTSALRVIVFDIHEENAALKRLDSAEANSPIIKIAISRVFIDAPESFFVTAAVTANRAIKLYGWQVAANGRIGGRWVQDTGFRGDDVAIFSDIDRHVLAVRQGSNVALTLWTIRSQGAQRTAGSTLVRNVQVLRSLNGKSPNLALAFTRHDSTFRLQRYFRSDTGIFQPGGAGAGGKVSFAHARADHLGDPVGGVSRQRTLSVAANLGPTAVRTGVFGGGRLMVGAGTLKLIVWQKPVGNQFDERPLERSAEVKLKGWFGIAFEAQVGLVGGGSNIVTVQKGVSTYKKFFASDRGKPLIRIIHWENRHHPESGNFGSLERQGHIDIPGKFSHLRLIDGFQRVFVVALSRSDGRLILKSFRSQE